MGTNYYLDIPAGPACPTCHHQEPSKTLHIGKSSGGWVFALRVYPELGINTLRDWFSVLTEGNIRDEYGSFVPMFKMISVITDRYWAHGHPDNLDPHAEHGPNGLLRNRVDGTHCVGHGPGTYDYFASDFS